MTGLSSWTFDCALWSRRCWQGAPFWDACEQHPQIWLSVSATTRKPRPGGSGLASITLFMTEQEFLAKEDAGEFLKPLMSSVLPTMARL